MAGHLDSWWAELQDSLEEEPSELAFRAVASILDTWPGEDRNSALSSASARLQSWPDDVRVASWTWCCAAASGAQPVSLLLSRTVHNRSMQCGCEPIPLTELHNHSFMRSITSVECGPLWEVPSLAPLVDEPGRWPAIRHLAADTSGEDDETFRRLVQSPLINQLESLRLELEHRSQRALGRLTLRGDQLVHLTLASGINDRLASFIESSQLPRLRALTLSCQGLDVGTSESARRLAQIPALRRLTRLELTGCFSEEVLAPLFSPMPLPLETLIIKGHPCSDYLPIVHEFWLTQAGLASLVGSASLGKLSELHIENERVGDGIVDLVAACTAGQLRRLSLVDVGLTDKGAKALSLLPQLTGVTNLDLSANLLGPEGIDAICRSPHLRGVQTLAIGGRFFNPYYDGKHSQPIGDDGLLAISKTPAFAVVQELKLSNAAIGPDGVQALARSVLTGRLRRLDLSTNDLCLAGARALACARWPNLRELRLRCCGLDDDAIVALASGDFGRLRDLDLSYNSVGPSGAAALGACAVLANLWRLSLHDNFIGDAGLLSLARSTNLTRLVELDIEQDCWNSRQSRFSDRAAMAVAKSSAFRRLDSFICGCVGEHYVERVGDAFTDLGFAEITSAASLRPAIRSGLLGARVDDGESELTGQLPEPPNPEAREIIQNFVHELSEHSRDADELTKPIADALTELLKSGSNLAASVPTQANTTLPPESAEQRRRDNDFRFRPKTVCRGYGVH